MTTSPSTPSLASIFSPSIGSADDFFDLVTNTPSTDPIWNGYSVISPLGSPLPRIDEARKRSFDQLQTSSDNTCKKLCTIEEEGESFENARTTFIQLLSEQKNERNVWNVYKEMKRQNFHIDFIIYKTILVTFYNLGADESYFEALFMLLKSITNPDDLKEIPTEHLLNLCKKYLLEGKLEEFIKITTKHNISFENEAYLKIIDMLDLSALGKFKLISRLEDVLNIQMDQAPEKTSAIQSYLASLHEANPSLTASYIFKQFAAEQIELDTSICCQILLCLRKMKNHTCFQQAWKLLEHNKCPFTPEMYSIYIKELCDLDQTREAIQILKKHLPDPISEKVFLSFFKSYKRKRNSFAICNILLLMQSRNVPFSLTSYTYLLISTIRNYQKDAIYALLNEMRNKNVRPDAKFYSILINARQIPREDKVELLFQMIDDNVVPIPLTFHQLLRHSYEMHNIHAIEVLLAKDTEWNIRKDYALNLLVNKAKKLVHTH